MQGQRAIPLVFFVSGSAGLIFEVVWFERCGLVFGNSIWATSVVLSAFMAGLGAGSALAGSIGHRIRQGLRAYAILELIVSTSGIALTYGLTKLTFLVAPLTRELLGIPGLVNAVRLVCAFIVLIVPTTAMGASLPLLVGVMASGSFDYAPVLGRLYGWNTLGAVAGTLVAEALLIGRWGLTGTAWIAAGLNVGAAAAALWMSRATRLRAADIAGSESDVGMHRAWRLFGCAFLAGANLLALEVIWLRFLAMFVVASTFAASLMLAVVLGGIGVGGLAASSWLTRRPATLVYLPAIAVAAACTLVGSYASFQFLTAGPVAAEWYRILWFTCVLTLPTSILSGVLFTFVGGAVKREVNGETRATAWTTFANTIGGMAGSLVAAFLLLPIFGMERSLLVLAIVYAGVGVMAFPDSVPGFRTGPARVFAVAAVTAMVVLGSFPFGVGARYVARAAQAYAADGSQIVATREGSSETVLLMQKAWMGRPSFHRLITNSFSMSGTQLAGKRYMRYFAYWPMLLRQAPIRRALVICYGVGVTAGAVADLKSVTSIDVVEISRDVVAMSDIIYPPPSGPLRDTRVRLHIEDGRNFMQTTTERFDLITGEPPPPLTPGTVNLYTQEYFELVRNRLSDRGIATYWLPVARRGEYEVKAIIRAFCEVFEDCSLWNGTPLDWMLVGTRLPTKPVGQEQVAAAWSDPALSPRLQEVGFEWPQQIGATFLGDAVYLNELTRDVLPLTDDYPQRLLPKPSRLSMELLTSDVSRTEFAFVGTVIDPLRARRAFERSSFVEHLWPEQLAAETIPFFQYQRIINRILMDGANPLRYIEDLHALLTRTSLRQLPLWALGSDEVQGKIAETGDDGTYMVPYVRGVHALAARNYLIAAELFADAEQRGLRPASSRPLLVYALCLAGDLSRARQLANGPMPIDSDRRHFWTWLGAAFGVGPGADHAS